MVYQINGLKGIYDDMNMNPSVKYGRNAVQNHNEFMESKAVMESQPIPPSRNEYGKDGIDSYIDAMEKYADGNDKHIMDLPPLEYEYRYMPQGGFDKLALLGAAYEELGTAEPIPVEDFDKYYLADSERTGKPLDINNDGKIDLGEYSTSIVAADVLSKGSTDPLKADGVISNYGFNALMQYAQKSNIAAAEKLYGDIYKTYDLGQNIDLK